MPNPILFFIFIIIVDLILKSLRDKKKIDMAMEKRQREASKPRSNSRPLTDLKRILEEEIQRERERQLSKQREVPKERRERPKAAVESTKITETPAANRVDTYENNKLDNNKLKDSIGQQKKDKYKEDIIKGIIFSEILSSPKSLQKHRRSL